MTFEVGEALNYMIDCFLRAPLVGTIAKNPIYTAIAITLMVIVVILIIFRDIEADETVLTMALRSGFWIFLMLLGIMMVHNRILSAENNQQTKDGLYERVITPSAAVRYDSEYVPVNSISFQGSGQNTNSMTATVQGVPVVPGQQVILKPILSTSNNVKE